MAQTDTIEIEVADFKEDPGNDCAFAVLFDVRGPGTRYELVMVAFTDLFLERYFRIRWNKRLPKEETRLVHEKRDLFVLWALLKVEQHLKGAIPSERIIVDYETDGAWAEKVEKGAITPQSRPAGEKKFLFSSR